MVLYPLAATGKFSAADPYSLISGARGVLGSDLIVQRPDWRGIDKPPQAGAPHPGGPAVHARLGPVHAGLPGRPRQGRQRPAIGHCQQLVGQDGRSLWSAQAAGSVGDATTWRTKASRLGRSVSSQARASAWSANPAGAGSARGSLSTVG